MSANRESWQDAPIDPGMVALCAKLNAVPGWQTVESCEGHPGRAGYEQPYVVVRAADCAALLRWVDRAERRRQALGGWPADRFITAVYEGVGHFRVLGRYVSPAQNAAIRQALTETL